MYQDRDKVVICGQRKVISIYRASDSLYVLFLECLKQAYEKCRSPIFQMWKQTERC